MASIEIKQLKKVPKNYLKNFVNYEFASLFELVFALFDNHKHGQQELIEIEALLSEIGYENLKDIPQNSIESIKTFIRSKLPEWQRLEESEYLSYKLMAAILSENVLVLVDDVVVENIEKPIVITPNSVITFIKKFKIDAISFKTL